ncbi:gag-pol polyprotein [Striga asiatica]|uniref:Gag-pol polyprotein n=1 Tax=Striga asiatica TaxID=4170 RepID=A0A5A7RBW5_STRAF|nr:gag-pol polyprotein [Striga asiatica]
MKIGKAFNKILDVNVPHGGALAGKCIRILAAIDINQPLLRCTNIQMGGTKVKVHFKYEWLVNFCFYCGRSGHIDRNCEKRTSDIGHDNLMEGLYGDWLKATDIFHTPTSNPSTTNTDITSHTTSRKPSNHSNIIPSKNPESPITLPHSESSHIPTLPINSLTPEQTPIHDTDNSPHNQHTNLA